MGCAAYHVSVPLDSYLEQVAEGYLFGDLASMARAEHDVTIGGGACGYPMVSTALSAMEALGFLLRSDRDIADRPMLACPKCGHRDAYHDDRRSQTPPSNIVLSQLEGARHAASPK